MKTAQAINLPPLKQRAQPRPTKVQRRLPMGAEVQAKGGTHFRVWAPRRKSVAVHLGKTAEGFGKSGWTVEMEPEANGYFSVMVKEAAAGMIYKFRLESGEFPDPASRFQPDGPHGPSEVVDPGKFKWSDQSWKGVEREGQVIYEMHIGSFAPAGTWADATAQLEELRKLGITLLELMPVADFPGRFGWGYDGVDLFAPTRLYGRPDDFRKFVDRAHAVGLGVILDVVYNHLGPDGNYLGEFTRDYFSTRYKNEWGEAINFDGQNCEGVREFFVANAGYWIDEYHLDGLRLDATQQIFDASSDNIMVAISRKVRAAGQGRGTYIVAENECQHAKLVRSVEEGGYGMDALWNDDFHHTAIVACTGRSEAYYTDYKGTPQEFISAVKWGFLYQGQWYRWQTKRRGAPALDLHPSQFVAFVQNHDQIANSLRGKRLQQLTSPGRLRAITTLLLLGPGTPMLFQGQEFGASAPFYYFADHNPQLAKLVGAGRKEYLKQFPSIASPECDLMFINPDSEETFRCCKLDFSEREEHADIYRMHRDLLRLRREDPAFARPRTGGVDGAVLAPEAFVLRFFGERNRNPKDGANAERLISLSPQRGEGRGEGCGERLMIVNFGTDLHLDPAPEPLLAPPEGCQWKLLWSSEDPCYGGSGTPPVNSGGDWCVPAHSAIVVGPETLRDLHGYSDTQN